MARLLDSPLTIVVIAVVVLLLFGAPKLPAMARSMGQSMRIFKSEVSEMKNDPTTNSADTTGDDSTANNATVKNTQHVSPTSGHTPPVAPPAQHSM